MQRERRHESDKSNRPANLLEPFRKLSAAWENRDLHKPRSKVALHRSALKYLHAKRMLGCPPDRLLAAATDLEHNIKAHSSLDAQQELCIHLAEHLNSSFVFLN